MIFQLRLAPRASSVRQPVSPCWTLRSARAVPALRALGSLGFRSAGPWLSRTSRPAGSGLSPRPIHAAPGSSVAGSLLAAHSRHPNRDPLSRQPHRSRIAAVTHPGTAVVPRVARPRERDYFIVQQLVNVHQPQRNQSADQLHLGVDVRGPSSHGKPAPVSKRRSLRDGF